MSTIKTLAKILAFILLTTSIIFIILFSPPYATKIQYNTEAISIVRNDYGIPFISAPSRISFLYGYGWVLAQDRAFQMAFRRVVAEGMVSQYLGEQALPMDKFMRDTNVGGWGEKMGQRMRRQNISEYRQIQAFVGGMNDCMASLITHPLDFHLIGLDWRNWTVSTVFKLYKLMQLSKSVTAFDQIFRSSLLANYTVEQIEAIFPTTKQSWAFSSQTTVADSDIPERLRTSSLKTRKQSEGKVKPEVINNILELQNLDVFKTASASNSWALSGNLTESGQPLLGTDPHLSNNIPSQWYQYEGCYFNNGIKYCLSAFSLPGTLFSSGKFNYLSVGITIVLTDNVDFFKEKVENDKYLVDGQWRDLKIRREVIKVKKNGGFEEIEYIVRQTHRGPIVNYYITELGNFQIPQHLSFQWTGASDHYTSLLDVGYLSQVNNLQQLIQLSTTGLGQLMGANFAIITNDGHIMNLQLGVYPLRNNPAMADFVKDGTNTQNDWTDFLPAEDKLVTIDPPCGYFVAANNKGASSQYYNDLYKDHPYTARADRITQLIQDYISKGIKLNAEISKKMMADTVDSYCQRILPFFLKALPQSGEYLLSFDCDFTSDSTAAPIYQVFFLQLHLLIKKTNILGFNLLGKVSHHQYLYNFIKAAENSDDNKKILLKAWQNTLKNPALQFNADRQQTKRWGELHKDVMTHVPFSKNNILAYFYSKVFEGSGNTNTINMARMNKVQSGNFDVHMRATNRAIFSYAEPSYWVVDSGVSQRFFSKHYDDQWHLFKANQFIEIKTLDNRSGSNEL